MCREFLEITRKDHGSEIFSPIRMEVQETHLAGIVGCNDRTFNDLVLSIVFPLFRSSRAPAQCRR